MLYVRLLSENVSSFFQFGNTCYCNSVLQALFFCKPFRDKVLQYKQQQKTSKRETLLSCLGDLFHSIATQKKKTGSMAPKKFIQRLKKENGLFIFESLFVQGFGWGLALKIERLVMRLTDFCLQQFTHFEQILGMSRSSLFYYQAKRYASNRHYCLF